MSRTYSLRSLIVVMTMVGVLVGIAVNFPVLFWSVAVLTVLSVPAIALAVVISIFSSHRIVTGAIGIVASLVGAVVGASQASTHPVLYHSVPPYLWRLFLDLGVPIVAYSTVAALLAGGFSLFLFPRAKPNRDSILKE